MLGSRHNEATGHMHGPLLKGGEDKMLHIFRLYIDML